MSFNFERINQNESINSSTSEAEAKEQLTESYRTAVEADLEIDYLKEDLARLERGEQGKHYGFNMEGLRDELATWEERRLNALKTASEAGARIMGLPSIEAYKEKIQSERNK